MDNFSHSLVGISIASSFRPVRPEIRPLLLMAGVIASNLPDLDLLMQLIDPSRLGYMINHRGHTHSFLFLLPLAFIVGAFIYFWARRKKIMLSGREQKRIYLVSAIALVFHIGLDYLNPYGIHFLAPLNNHWFYRDTLYIIEPWLWVALLPLTLSVVNKKLKAFFIGATGSLVIGAIIWGVLGWPMGLLMFITATGIFLWQKRFSLASQALLSLGFLLLAIIMFSVGSILCRSALEKSFDASRGYVLKDIALSPMPGNPFCWSFLTVEQNAQNYRVSAGTYQHLASLLPQTCPSWIKPEGVALSAMTQSSFQPNTSITEQGEYQENLNEIFADEATNCRLHDWLTFARVPHREGTRFNDLRYAVKAANNFSTFDLNETLPHICPPIRSRWISPFQVEK